MSAPLAALLDWYATLTPDSLARLPQFYAGEARFKDPFNEVQGIAAISRIFTHMFESTDHPRFVIVDQMAQGNQGFATWRFEFGLKGRQYTVLGASHLHFGADGRVVSHRDYWDAAEELWQKLPVIGVPVRWLRRRFTAA